MTADKFVQPDTLLILALGLVAFVLDTAGGLILTLMAYPAIRTFTPTPIQMDKAFINVVIGKESETAARACSLILATNIETSESLSA